MKFKWSILIFAFAIAALPASQNQYITVYAQNTNSNLVPILSSSSYIDDAGNMHVVGEVLNNSTSTVDSVKVVGTFYDANARVVGTSFTYIDYNLTSKGKAPFDIILLQASIPMQQIHNYKIVSAVQ
jgi:hypothetical protein